MKLSDKVEVCVIDKVKELMKNGILTDKETGLKFYTGYQYKTLYDWDQYFEAIVQLYMDWDTTYIENGVKLFLDNQKENGFICRSIPGGFEGQLTEHAKPFLAQIILMLLNEGKDISWFSDNYYVKLKKYILYWINDKDKNKNYLPTWDSAPHTGMDNQHERAGWWYDCFCEGVDLASFLYRECKAFVKLAEYKNHQNDVTKFNQYALNIKNAVNDLMWNEEDEIYYDIDERTGKQIRVKYIGTFAPLWAGIVDESRAKLLINKHLLNKKEFWREFPVCTLAATEEGYSETKLENDLGCCWRAQTWIPTNYYVFEALRNNGYEKIAKELADKTYEVAKKVGFREYYNTESVTGNGLDPFWGWSLLAAFMPAEYESGKNITKIN